MRSHKLRGFTLIELLTVIAIIFVLAGLVLSVSQYVVTKGKKSRAQSEIAAMSAACESYKADNGVYPDDGTYTTTYVAGNTAKLNAQTDGNPLAGASNPSGGTYPLASVVLYRALSGDMDCNGSTSVTDGNLNLSGVISGSTSTTAPTVYMSFKPTQLVTTGGTTAGSISAIKDPWGYSYGYSTAYAGVIASGSTSTTQGYNPTFDLWTTCGATALSGSNTFSQYQQTWITNW